MKHLEKNIDKQWKKVNLSEALRNSGAFQKAIKEGRVGGRAHKEGKPSDETKQKIRESLLEYFKVNGNTTPQIDIEKHREVMTKAKGRKVIQYNKDGNIVKEYISISEAGRNSGVKLSNICRVLSGFSKTAGGYIWKYAEERT